MADPMCIVCCLPKSMHREMGTPLRLWCPPRQTEFTACQHKRRQGFGSVCSDGTGYGENVCQDCFERFPWGTPPNSGDGKHE